MVDSIGIEATQALGILPQHTLQKAPPPWGAPLFGGGGPNLVEPQALTVSIGRKVAWRKDRVDLTELAKLRWVDKWTIERLAKHFGLGTTSIKMNLRQLRK